ncbi:hypothetical protein [Blastococcus sp. CT_GayMR19]|nr:hypothetical protein [Blastococcus sp. CT_GayMR19]
MTRVVFLLFVWLLLAAPLAVLVGSAIHRAEESRRPGSSEGLAEAPR